MTTDYNDLLRDCVAEFPPNKRPARPTRTPERYEAGMIAEPFEYEPVESWGPPLPKLPRAPKPPRWMLAFAALMAIVPAQIMPALLIIPVVAPLLALAWIVARMLWTGEIVLAW